VLKLSFCDQVKKDVSILLTSLLSKLTALEKFESMIHKFSVEAAETPLNSVRTCYTLSYVSCLLDIHTFRETGCVFARQLPPFIIRSEVGFCEIEMCKESLS